VIFLGVSVIGTRSAHPQQHWRKISKFRFPKMFNNQPMNASLAKQLPSIAALCQRYGVAHLELFGSATSAEFNPESSDFDFLVELDKSSPGSPARRWIELAEALEKLLGRHVDLVNPHYIRNPYFAQAVNASRTVIYDRQVTQAAG
jgi:predicted nucleotidyltransferase